MFIFSYCTEAVGNNLRKLIKSNDNFIFKKYIMMTLKTIWMIYIIWCMKGMRNLYLHIHI